MASSTTQQAVLRCQGSAEDTEVVFPRSFSSSLSFAPPGVWQPRTQNNDNVTLCTTNGSATMTLNYQSNNHLRRVQLFGSVKQGRSTSAFPELRVDSIERPLAVGAESLFDSQSQQLVLEDTAKHQLTVSNSDNFRLCISCFRLSSNDGLSSSSSAIVPAVMTTSSARSEPSAASNPVNSSSGSAHQDKLSDAVKGVIIALVLILVALIMLAATWVWLRRARRRRLSTPETIVGGKADLNGYDDYADMDTPINTAAPRRPARYFASFSQSSVSSIPQPPHSEEPPSTAAASVVRQLTNATMERLRSLRREGRQRDRELNRINNRRPVLRAINV